MDTKEQWIGVNSGYGAPGDTNWHIDLRNEALLQNSHVEESIFNAEVEILAKALICRRHFYYGMDHEAIKKVIAKLGISRFYEKLLNEDRMTEEDITWIKGVVERDQDVVNQKSMLRPVLTLEQYKMAGDDAVEHAAKARQEGESDLNCRIIAKNAFESNLFWML